MLEPGAIATGFLLETEDENFSDNNNHDRILNCLRYRSEYEHKAKAGVSDANSPRSGTGSKGNER